MELLHRPLATEQLRLQLDLAPEVVNVGDRVRAVFGHDLVTGAVVADRGAEGYVKVE
jgi:hypothetical protein